MKIKLNKKRKKSLKKDLKADKSHKEKLKIMVILNYNEGYTVDLISKMFFVDKTTVHRYIDEYIANKEIYKNKSKGSESKLSESQSFELNKYLVENTQINSNKILEFIKKNFKISYSKPGIINWLKRNNFVYKKPKLYPCKVNIEEQDYFIEKYKELIKKEDKSKIYFMDSVHPTMQTKTSFGWIKKGTEKHIKASASRSRMNINGAISLNDLTNPIICEYDTININSINDFLEKLRKKVNHHQKLFIICDSAGYYKNKEIIEKSKKLNIELIFLPPYSPNLNIIERLWKILNEEVRNNIFFNNFKEFRQSILNFFEKGIKKIEKKLKSRLTDNFQKLSVAK